MMAEVTALKAKGKKRVHGGKKGKKKKREASVMNFHDHRTPRRCCSSSLRNKRKEGFERERGRKKKEGEKRRDISNANLR